MKSNAQIINLDLTNDIASSTQIVKVASGDENSRPVYAKICDRGVFCEDLNIENIELYIESITNDPPTYVDGLSVVNGICEFDIPSSATVSAGQKSAALRIVQDDEILCTMPFTVICVKSPYSADALRSTDEGDILKRLANEAKSAEAVASGAAEVAENSAEQAVAAEQYLKSAIVDGGIEFVFKGGDASSKRSVALTVDGELNAASENPVKNKVLAEKSKQTDEALTELGEDIEKHKTEFEKSLEALKTKLLIQAKLDAHPVGCLYWSEKATDPSELFGGTWERIKDSFVWAAGDIEEITYTKDGEIVTEKLTVGKTGGEVTHKLTVEEMPEHKHDKILMGAGGNYQITYLNVGDLGSGQSAGVGVNGSQPIYTSTAGGSQPHNNMPPYIAMYCWKRTA